MVENGRITVILAWNADKTFYIPNRYIACWVDLLCLFGRLRDGLCQDITLVGHKSTCQSAARFLRRME